MHHETLEGLCSISVCPPILFSSEMVFSGKVTLVTGAAGGFGKAIAHTFLRAGVFVSICDVQEELLEATTEKLNGAGFGGGSSLEQSHGRD